MQLDNIYYECEPKKCKCFLLFCCILQVAAVIGIGLVYQGTGHRHNAEVLLSEIGASLFGRDRHMTDTK